MTLHPFTAELHLLIYVYELVFLINLFILYLFYICSLQLWQINYVCIKYRQVHNLDKRTLKSYLSEERPMVA